MRCNRVVDGGNDLWKFIRIKLEPHTEWRNVEVKAPGFICACVGGTYVCAHPFHQLGERGSKLKGGSRKRETSTDHRVMCLLERLHRLRYVSVNGPSDQVREELFKIVFHDRLLLPTWVPSSPSTRIRPQIRGMNVSLYVVFEVFLTVITGRDPCRHCSVNLNALPVQQAQSFGLALYIPRHRSVAFLPGSALSFPYKSLVKLETRHR